MSFVFVYYKDTISKKYTSNNVKFVVFTNYSATDNQSFKDLCMCIKAYHESSHVRRYDSHYDKRYVIEGFKIEDIKADLKRVRGFFDFNGLHHDEESLFYINHHVKRLIKETGWIKHVELAEDIIALDLDCDSSSGNRTQFEKMRDNYLERVRKKEVISDNTIEVKIEPIQKMKSIGLKIEHGEIKRINCPETFVVDSDPLLSICSEELQIIRQEDRGKLMERLKRFSKTSHKNIDRSSDQYWEEVREISSQDVRLSFENCLKNKYKFIEIKRHFVDYFPDEGIARRYLCYV